MFDNHKNAFEKWFQEKYKNDIQGGAVYLMECIVDSPAELVWEYLRATKDEVYTLETFMKATKLILTKE
jgi:hypothetical protein